MNYDFELTKITGALCVGTSLAIPFIPAGQRWYWQEQPSGLVVDLNNPMGGGSSQSIDGSIIMPGQGGPLNALILQSDGKMKASSWFVGDWARDGDNIACTFDWFKYNTGCSGSLFPPIWDCNPNVVTRVLINNPNSPYTTPAPPDECAPNVIND